MSNDFYLAVATVLPLLLLALIWDSHILDSIRSEDRLLKKVDAEHGVRFWTKPRVRRYMLFVATTIVAAVGLCIIELAGFVPNSLALRWILVLAVVLTLGTLLTRIWVDVSAATASRPPLPGEGRGVRPGTGGQDGQSLS
jgi:hypothetical protein